MKFLRRQGYDDASEMNGKLISVHVYIGQKHPLAVYVHCGARSLNLAIIKACSVALVRNCMAIVSSRFVKVLVSLPVTTSRRNAYTIQSFMFQV
jgi:hypothetical protein